MSVNSFTSYFTSVDEAHSKLLTKLCDNGRDFLLSHLVLFLFLSSFYIFFKNSPNILCLTKINNDGRWRDLFFLLSIYQFKF